MKGPGRRGLRAEFEATWQVWDAVRPVRAEDMAEPSPPEVASTRDPNRAPPPDEGTIRTGLRSRR